MKGVKRKGCFGIEEVNSISEALGGEITFRYEAHNTAGVLLRKSHGNVFLGFTFDEEVIEVSMFQKGEPFPPKPRTEEKERFHIIQLPGCKAIYYLIKNQGGSVVFEDKDNRTLEITPKGFVYQRGVLFENF